MKQIPLGGKNGKGKFVLVDDEDYPILSRLNWTLAEHGYVKNHDFYIHSLVMGFSRTQMVDHKDRNPLNNQKSNLRWATKQQNAMNSNRKAGTTSSIYKGVTLKKNLKSKPWMTTISRTIDGKREYCFIGYFKTQKEAAIAYDAKAREFYGEFAFLNFP